jgi:hypothetical protein
MEEPQPKPTEAEIDEEVRKFIRGEPSKIEVKDKPPQWSTEQEEKDFVLPRDTSSQRPPRRNERFPTQRYVYQPPRESMNRLWSILAWTVSAVVGPISSTFRASAAWRMARDARSRTEGGTLEPETNSRRVAIASEARERTSARSRSLRNNLARFNPAMNSGSSRNHSATDSESQPATSAPSDSVPAKRLTACVLFCQFASLFGRFHGSLSIAVLGVGTCRHEPGAMVEAYGIARIESDCLVAIRDRLRIVLFAV